MRTAGALAILVMCLGACAQGTASPPPQPAPPSASDAAATSPAPLAPELAAYLDEALALIQEHSLYCAAPDCSELPSLAYRAAADAHTIADLHPVLRMAVGATGDRHGYVVPRADVTATLGTDGITVPVPTPAHDIVAGCLAHLTVPTFATTDPAAAREFADGLRDAIREMNEEDLCGWIADVRYNEGGNGIAMLAGLSPLLGEGLYGYHAYPDGRRLEWKWENGRMYLGDAPLIALPDAAENVNLSAVPVAVLTNEVTTSAGEMVAIAFRGRANTRSFGQATLGRTTAPEGFPLSDGAILGMSVAYFTDRSGQRYTDRVMPDERIVAHDDPTYRSREVPQVAIDWLLGRPECNAGAP